MDIGQPGSARATANTARFVLHVIENPEEATTVPQKVPQQNVAFQDNMGFDSGGVEWRGMLKVSTITVWRAIAAELNRYRHGSGRTNGTLQAPLLNYIRPTRLTDFWGNVMSEKATVAEWRSGQIRRLSGSEPYTYALDLTVKFRLLG
jgi:hypothetical protein